MNSILARRLALVSGLVATGYSVDTIWADAVGISGTAFTIDGSVTYPARRERVS